MPTGEKVGEAYVDLVISDESVNNSLKTVEAKVVTAMKKWPTEFRLKADPNAEFISRNLKLKVDQITAAEKERLNIILNINDALDQEISRMVAITNQQKQQQNGFITNLFSPGGLKGNQRQIMNQLSYGLQDFVTVLSMPGMGLSGALRGASNNISMMLMGLSPLAALISSVAVSALPGLIDYLSQTKSATEKATQANEALAESFRKLQSSMEFQSRLRQAGTADEGKSTEAINSDIRKTARDIEESAAKRKDIEAAIAEKRDEIAKGETHRVGAAGLRTMEFEMTPREMTELGMDVFRERAAAVMGRMGLNPEEHTAQVVGDELVISRLHSTERIKELEKQINELENARLGTLREEEVARARIEAMTAKRGQLMALEESRVQDRNRLIAGGMSENAAEQLSQARSDRRSKAMDVISMMASGVLSEAEGNSQLKTLDADLENKEKTIRANEGKRKEAEAKRQANEAEQRERFNAALEIGGLSGSKSHIALRRQQALEQFEEDQRRNAEMPGTLAQKMRGDRAAQEKYQNSMRQITEDEERIKSRVRIDALKFSNPKKWAEEEAEDRRKQRLKALEDAGIEGPEKEELTRSINANFAKERRELMKQAERRNPAEFIGGEAMWKKIQLSLLGDPNNQKLMQKSAEETARNTQKAALALDTLVQQKSTAQYA